MSILNSLSHTLLSAQVRLFHPGPASSNTPQPGDEDFVGPLPPSADQSQQLKDQIESTAPSPGDADFVGPLPASPEQSEAAKQQYEQQLPQGDTALDLDQLKIDPYYLPEQAPISKPTVPAVKPDSTWLESMGIGQGVASAIWWALGTLLVLAFIIAVVVWVVRRRDGRGQDSHGPAIVVYAAVGMGALWSLILWGFSRT